MTKQTKIANDLRQFAKDNRERGWKRIADDLEAAADLIEREAAVPSGWQLVPVEPTEEMLAATSWPGCARADYEHMLAAGPTPLVYDENASQERVRSTPENEHEPVAWRYWNEKSDSWNTTTSAPVADAMRDGDRSVEPLYLRSPALRMPEPMTDNELVEIYRALPKNGPIVRDGSTTIRLGRAIEAEVLRRVREANND